MSAFAVLWIGIALVIAISCRWALRFGRIAALLIPLALLGAASVTVKATGESVLDERDDSAYRMNGRIRIVFQATSIAAGRAASLGGGDKDDLQIQGLPEGLVRLSKDGSISTSSKIREGNIYIASAGAPGASDSSPPEQTWLLSPGSKLCLAGGKESKCDANQLAWTLNPGKFGELILSGGAAQPGGVRKACSLTAGVPLFSIRALFGKVPTLASRVFPLQNYGRVLCQGGPLTFVNAEDEVGPFVFFHFNSRGDILVSSIGQTETGLHLIVERGSKVSGVEGSQSLEVSDVPIAIRLQRIAVSRPNQALEVEGFWPLRREVAEVGVSKLVTLRTLEVSSMVGSERAPRELMIRQVPPAFLDLDSTESCAPHTQVTLRSGDDLARGTSVRVPLIDDLTQLGAQGAAIYVDRFQNADGNACLGKSVAQFSASGPNGVIEKIPPGQVFAFGDATVGRLFFTVSEVSVPWLAFACILLGSALLRLVIRMGVPTAVSSQELVITSLVDGLLVLRVIAAVQEATLAPREGAAVRDAILALAVVPVLLDLTSAYGQRGVRFLLLLLSKETRFGALAHALSSKAVSFLARDKVPQTAESLSSRRDRLLLVAIFSLPLLHLVAILCGIREKLGPMRTSTWLVPLYIVGVAYLVRWSDLNSGTRPAGAVIIGVTRYMTALAFIILCSLAFRAANDTGAIIYFFGPLFFVAYLAMCSSRLSPSPLSIIFGLLACVTPAVVFSALVLASGGDVRDLIEWNAYHTASIVLALLVLLYCFWIRGSGNIFALVPALAVSALIVVVPVGGLGGKGAQPCDSLTPNELANCFERTQLKTNQLRLASGLFPHLVEAEFSREANGMRAVFDELDWLNGDKWSGTSGRGFMTIPPRRGLDRFDNSFSSHAISPFGSPFAFILIASFLAVILSAFRYASSHLTKFGAVLSGTAISVLGLVSIYIILGNLLLVPFTGRNVYLTGALSTSDLVEGVVLVLLAIFGTCAAQSQTTGNIHSENIGSNPHEAR